MGPTELEPLFSLMTSYLVAWQAAASSFPVAAICTLSLSW